MTQEYQKTYKEVNGDGSNNISFSFPSIHQTDIKVSVDGTVKTNPTHYVITGYTPTGGGVIQFTSGNIPTSGKILIYRDTPIGLAKSTYAAGSSVKESDLNNNQKQFLHVAQEIEEDIEDLTIRQRFFTSTTPPPNPINGAVWYEPTSGRSFVYYTDVDTAQWVESSPAYSAGDGSNVQTDITSLTDANIAANANINGSKLLNDSIGMGKLGSGTLPSDITVTVDNLGTDSVDSDELVDGSVDLSHMSANSIDSDQYVDGSIEGVHLENGAITNTQVNANAAIDASKISYKHGNINGVARTLKSRLQHIININDFIPTNVTTSTTNCAGYINAAINALPEGGGKIIFPPAIYKLTSEIVINSTTSDPKNAIVLEGACGMVVGSDNYGARFFRADNDNNTFISITNARSIEVRNIGFIGGTVNGTNTGGAGVKPANGAIHVIAQPGTQEHIYENLTFDGITFCMNFDGLSSSMIRNCKFRTIPENSADSHIIKLHGSNPPSGTDRMDQIRIVDCIIDGSPAPALSANRGKWATNTTYSVNDLIENDRERIYKCIAVSSDTDENGQPINTGLSASSGNGPNGANSNFVDNNCTWQWQGNKINHTMRGVYIDSEVSTVFVSRTSVIRCRDNYYIAGTWNGNFINFENAEAERAAYDGFNINGTGNFITIADCFAGTNYEQGINLGDAQNSTVQISNVNCRDNRQNGILINSSTQNVSITNPTIGGNGSSNNNTYNGISIGSTRNHVFISGGKCGGRTEDLAGTGPQRYGIQVNGNNHDHIVILGVDVSGNTTGGIEWTTTGGNVNASNDNFIQFCPGYSTGQTSFP